MSPRNTMDKNEDLAARFFSKRNPDKEPITQKSEVPKQEPLSSEKNKGGRPPKKGLKSMNFTISMDPIKFEQIRILAQTYATNGSISQFLNLTIDAFCKQSNISLSEIEISDDIIKRYEKKQLQKYNKHNK